MEFPKVLCVILALQDDVSSALTALTSLAAAIDTAEDHGLLVTTVIVNASGEPAVVDVLNDVEGALVINAPDARADTAGCWQRGLAACEGDIDSIWLGTNQSVVKATDLVEMNNQLYASPDSDVILSAGGSQSHCLLRAEERGQIDLLNAAAPASTFTNLFAAAQSKSVTAVLRANPQERRTFGVGASQATLDIVHPSCFSIGANSQLGSGTLVKTWSASEQIRIGSYCSGSTNVTFAHPGSALGTFTDRNGVTHKPRARGFHRPATASTFPIGVMLPDAPYDDIPQDGSLLSKPQTVGSDVWIGWGATIMGPVTIGDGAIIGAHAVVMSDVPPYAVVGGNPAKVLRMRFSAATVEKLLQIRWWDWADDRVLMNYQWFERPINEFIEHFTD